MISDWATSSVICCRHRLQMASSRRKFKMNIRQRKTIVLVRPNSSLVSFIKPTIYIVICSYATDQHDGMAWKVNERLGKVRLLFQRFLILKKRALYSAWKLSEFFGKPLTLSRAMISTFPNNTEKIKCGKIFLLRGLIM